VKVLVAYATRHGATRGIAECIGTTLERRGFAVTTASVDTAGSLEGYDAFVVGSASYMGHWLEEATAFVRSSRERLAARPTWLFSSGPIGTAKVDAQGRSVLETSAPLEFRELGPRIGARGMQVFFGVYDPDLKPIGLAERMAAPFMRRAAIRDATAGDFRDWAAIEAWADGIADELVRPAEAAAAETAAVGSR
jgi:menaquinone-dependent protoporphyrinogen oxidase